MLDQLEDKNILMLIGKTGVGKTTFFLACLGIKLKKIKNNIDHF
jgi:flagellar biosynthesis GTPase FlhF